MNESYAQSSSKVIGTKLFNFFAGNSANLALQISDRVVAAQPDLQHNERSRQLWDEGDDAPVFTPFEYRTPP